MDKGGSEQKITVYAIVENKRQDPICFKETYNFSAPILST